jgi:hypothetical protein
MQYKYNDAVLFRHKNYTHAVHVRINNNITGKWDVYCYMRVTQHYKNILRGLTVISVYPVFLLL